MDMLLTITSAGDDLYKAYQLRWLWTILNLLNKETWCFFATLVCGTHFKNDLRQNH